MSTVHWIGKADAVAQQATATPGGTIGTETFTLTVGGESVTYAAQGGDTATEVAAGLRDAWNAATHPYFTGVTATAAAGVATLDADTAGVPFVVAGAATGSATLTVAVPVASAGPNDWSTNANWSGGSKPAASDTVVIENSAVPILWGLDQAGVTLAELRIMQSYTGTIGLPEDQFTTGATDSDTTKPEYRETYLKISATMVRIGEHYGSGNPAGAGRIKLDTGSNQTQLNVANSATTSTDGNLEPIRWLGSHASNAVNVTKGRLGVATTVAGETATISELNVGQRGNLASDADVNLGPGVTITTLNQSAGEVVTAAGLTTVNQSGGTVTSCGAATIATANIGGAAYFNATGTITTLRVVGAGSADFSRDPRDKTVTNCELHKGAQLNLDNGNPLSVTFTNDIDFIRCEPRDTTFITGPHVTLGLSAV